METKQGPGNLAHPSFVIVPSLSALFPIRNGLGDAPEESIGARST